MNTAAVITPAELLEHWQGLRRLSRRVIEAFPEDKLFTFSIGGMRPYGALAAEMLAIAVPLTKEIVTGEPAAYAEDVPTTKTELLERWDAATAELPTWFAKVPAHRFSEVVTLFGQFTGPVWSQFAYAMDNENHHRGQGYVYLRALGITPPPFYER